MLKKIAVLGAGDGGQACAASLSMDGYEVNLYNRSAERLKPILERGAIQTTGAKEGFAKLNKITTDIKEAIKGVDLILIVVPAFAHKQLAETCIPHLEDGQIITYIGKGGGTLVFAQALKSLGVKKNIILGETNTLPYASKSIGPAQIRMGILKKGGFLAAALPAKNTKKLINVLREIYPIVVPATNVLETLLTDFNAIDHVASLIPNIGHVENSTGEYLLFKEGVSPSVGRIIQAVDRERLAIMKTLGLNQTRYEEWLFKQGFIDSIENTVYEAIRKSTLKGAISCGPSIMEHRFITEDVPYGLVTMASLGDMLGVPTPVIKSLITLASVMNQVDYWKEGRTVEKLGISGLNVDELREFVTEGKL
jgi:opine dehydrogenase